MPFDLLDSCQQVARGAGNRLRGAGLLPEKRWERQEVEGEALENVLARGRRQAEGLARRIEAYTGRSLDGARLLDYGCGTGRVAVALAERCERLYGLDIMPGALRMAQETAAALGVHNAEWLDASSLPALAGRYDAVISTWVFQHIPTRQGERILRTILEGLAPGGVGAIHFTMRPPRALTGVLSAARSEPRMPLRSAATYAYLLMNSYSMNRLGPILCESGVPRWQVGWWYYGASNGGRYPSATLIFRKDDALAAGAENGAGAEEP